MAAKELGKALLNYVADGMNRIYLIILFVGTLVRTGSVHAQQQVSVSQYMFNGLFLNPGSAGSHAYATSSLLHRSQWAQMEGAPTTSMVAFDAPLMKQKIGAGFTVVHDRIGISKDLDLSGNFEVNWHSACVQVFPFILHNSVVCVIGIPMIKFLIGTSPMYP